ncbi:sulfurtransferase [Paenibacillus flagellatus]|uniref:thiosulfate sulfurtransferase n=1 Tax=Paenibacillus flagellatus TaxID=2211139 RepID=A0A2V5K741_9BACL|nr:sulfurtransferase [Paenibacillus flagellatus]PYI55275.1 sulfurtransferase [Paenibacillus flagellatus]
MKSKLVLISLLVLAGVAAACGSKPESGPTNASGGGGGQTAQQTKTPETYPNAQLLADVKWVEEHAKDPNVKIIDARSKGYEQGHIPGAISINSGLLKDGKNNAIIGKEAFTELFQKAGVNNDTTVVVYDEGAGNGATRLFYGLEYYGLKDKVKVLNGGYLAWTSAGKEQSTETPTPAKGNFTAVPNDKLITTKDQLLNANLQQCTLLDTRSAKEFSGEDLRGNKKGGHLQGAIHKEWSEAIDQNPADGVPKFKSFAELNKLYTDAGVTDKEKTIIPYCQTNIRGAHSYFTLRLLGFKDIRPYEGSWAEWGNADDTPVVKS